MKTHGVEIFMASVSVFPGGRGSAVWRELATRRTETHVKHGGDQIASFFSWVPDRKVESLLHLVLHIFYFCV